MTDESYNQFGAWRACRFKQHSTKMFWESSTGTILQKFFLSFSNMKNFLRTTLYFIDAFLYCLVNWISKDEWWFPQVLEIFFLSQACCEILTFQFEN